MTLLVTGATGFVMSVLGRHWLEADPRARLVVLDASPLDAAVQRYFAPFSDRLAVVVADVTEPETWRPALARHAVTRIVHGATITPISRGTATAAKREPEAENPDRIIDGDGMGTVAVLGWGRTMPSATTFTLRMLRARLSRCCRRRGFATAPTTSPAVRPRASAIWLDGRRKKCPGLAPRLCPPSKPTSCRTLPSRTACGVLTMFRASAVRPAGRRGPGARHCMPTWTGWRPSAAPARHRNQDDSQ